METPQLRTRPFATGARSSRTGRPQHAAVRVAASQKSACSSTGAARGSLSASDEGHLPELGVLAWSARDRRRTHDRADPQPGYGCTPSRTLLNPRDCQFGSTHRTPRADLTAWHRQIATNRIWWPRQASGSTNHEHVSSPLRQPTRASPPRAGCAQHRSRNFPLAGSAVVLP